MADADDPNLVTGGKQTGNSLCQHFDGAGRGFLDQNIAGNAVLEGKQHQVHSFVQAHNETSHRRLGDGDGVARLDLINPQRDDRTAGAHNITIAGAADFGDFGSYSAAFCHDDLFHHCLGGAHGVDRIGSLVGGQADHILNTGFDGSSQHIVSADHVGLHGLHRKELAGGNLLQSSSMENIVHTVHSVLDGSKIPHVTDEKFDFVGNLGHFCLEFVAHIVLLLFVTGEYTNLSNIGLQEAVKHSVAERAGTAGNHQSFAGKNRHNAFLQYYLWARAVSSCSKVFINCCRVKWLS